MFSARKDPGLAPWAKKLYFLHAYSIFKKNEKNSVIGGSGSTYYYLLVLYEGPGKPDRAILWVYCGGIVYRYRLYLQMG